MRLLFRRHAVAILALTATTAWWLSPVLRHLDSAIPGAGAGDNVTFLWNLWWMRYVLHHPGYSFFSTPFLFHPFGVDLTLHTHTALPALVAAVAGPASLVASQNLLVIVHVWLNFVCSYALAYRVTRHTPGALAAALVFGTSPFIAAHLTGHFNLMAARPLADEGAQMDPPAAAAQLTSLGIAYIVIDTRRASPDLIRYVRSAIALEPIGDEDGRAFYRVVP